MKKRTDEEKLQMVNEACDLINVAREKMKQARKMLHLCGVDICECVWVDDMALILIRTNIEGYTKKQCSVFTESRCNNVS